MIESDQIFKDRDMCYERLFVNYNRVNQLELGVFYMTLQISYGPTNFLSKVK